MTDEAYYNFAAFAREAGRPVGQSDWEEYKRDKDFEEEQKTKGALHINPIDKPR
jgi:hypothetical protein